MATLSAAERTEPPPQRMSAERPSRVETRRISIDANFVAIAGLLALALAAFAYLNSRIDNLGTELRTEIKRYSERTDDKIDRLNDKMDKLTDKMNELLINQKRGS